MPDGRSCPRIFVHLNYGVLLRVLYSRRILPAVRCSGATAVTRSTQCCAAA